MLKEHAEVGRLIEGVRRAASKSNDERGLTLMDQLAHHAAIEEEVLYPAATLAGMIAKSLEEARTR